MTPSRVVSSKTVADEVLWLARHRKEDAWALVRGFRRLTRGRRGELGPVAAWFVSNLEIALRSEQRRLRAEGRKKKLKAKIGKAGKTEKAGQ